MGNASLTTARWAEETFGGVELGDRRRTERLVKVAGCLAETPGGTLPKPLGGWGDLKAAYRLLHRPEVNLPGVQRRHWEGVRSECANAGEYALFEDTTEMDYTSHLAVEGLGRIGDNRGRGFLLHTTLAVRVERWTPEGRPVLNVLGLFGQHLWRRLDEPKKKKESRRARYGRARESAKWLKTMEETDGPPAGTVWIFIADREADMAEVYLACGQRGMDWVIRACKDRALEGEDRHIWAVAKEAPLLGVVGVQLRARPGQPARLAKLAVRARPVTLRGPWRPEGRLPPLAMNVVDVQEVEAPEGVEPLHWTLFTSLSCQTLERCVRVIQLYCQRWLVEEYHKALKTGTGVEGSQLETVAALEALIGILALVAVRLLQLKLLARAAPEQRTAAGTLGKAEMAVLEKKWGRPVGGWTNRALLVAIARLGGFLARRGDGDPGWLTIWRGWQRLANLSEGYALGVG